MLLGLMDILGKQAILPEIRRIQQEMWNNVDQIGIIFKKCVFQVNINSNIINKLIKFLLIRTNRSHPPTQIENGKKCDFTHTFLSLF